MENEPELLAIGRVARRSGLTVSALRFYDGAGVLIPAVVDERSGYRWYGVEQVAQACLLARLRRVRMPLVDIARVLALQPQGRSAGRRDESLAILDAHLRRLEAGLADARRELSTARALLEPKESTMNSSTPNDGTPNDGTPNGIWMTMPGADLAAALRAVRFAVGVDPDLPALGGVLLDVDPGDGLLRLVATDRYRMAVSSVAALAGAGPPARVTAATRFVDDVLAGLGDGPVTLRIDADRIRIEGEAGTLTDGPLEGDFPDYRRLLPAPHPDPAPVDVAELRAAITAAGPRRAIREQDGEPYDVIVLALDPAGAVTVVPHPDPDLESAGGRLVGVNREFLLAALNAGTSGQLLLELDGPIAPLALRDPDRPGTSRS